MQPTRFLRYEKRGGRHSFGKLGRSRETRGARWQRLPRRRKMTTRRTRSQRARCFLAGLLRCGRSIAPGASDDDHRLVLRQVAFFTIVTSVIGLIRSRLMVAEASCQLSSCACYQRRMHQLHSWTLWHTGEQPVGGRSTEGLPDRGRGDSCAPREEFVLTARGAFACETVRLGSDDLLCAGATLHLPALAAVHNPNVPLMLHVACRASHAAHMSYRMLNAGWCMCRWRPCTITLRNTRPKTGASTQKRL